MNRGLILVDIQNDYFPEGRMELSRMLEASLKAKELLLHFREKGLPTFHIQHVSAGAKAGFFIPGTDGVKIHENVAPLPGDVVIEKHYPNSFRQTPLLESLKQVEVDELVICGAMTHMCIDATTRAAADLGFRCVLIHDACATRDLEFDGKTVSADDVHCSFLAALQFFYARVVSLEGFLTE